VSDGGPDHLIRSAQVTRTEYHDRSNGDSP